MRENELRREMVEICRRMYQRGLIAACDGNVSALLNDDRILVTPSGLGKGFLTEADLLVVDRRGKKLRGARQPSSEFRMHQLAYELRPDIAAIVHAHPPVSVGLALAGISLAQCVLSETCLLLGPIPTAPYATPTTDEVPEALRPYLRKANAIVLDRHGALTFGRTLEEAYQRLEAMEHAAKITHIARTLGPVTPLTADQAAKLEQVAVNLGIPRPPEPCKSCNVCSCGKSSNSAADDNSIVEAVIKKLRNN